MTREMHAVEVMLFDAAGTLFELAEPVGQVYARIAAAHGLEVEAGRLERAFRMAWRNLRPPLHPEGHPPEDDDQAWWREVVRQSFVQVLDAPLSEARLDALFDSLYEHFARAEAWRLFPDTRPALERLWGRMRLMVLSNFDRRLHAILHCLGIADFFEDVIVSSSVGASKPHPRMFAAALRAAGVPPQCCLHVGDEEDADLLGATAAGMQAVLVRRPEFTLLDAVEKVLPPVFSCLRAAPK